ncbi:map, partial [Symbiodinium necroappetens]
AAAMTQAGGGPLHSSMNFLSEAFAMGAFPYVFLYIIMVYFFSYFWTTVQFNPEDMSKQLRDHGSFIPGLRPGPRTAEYLEAVMERITYVGAGFLSIIAIVPMIVNRNLNIDFGVAQFLGGTGLLIVVSVGLDFVQRIEANLLMRNYAGFLGGNEKGKGPKIREIDALTRAASLVCECLDLVRDAATEGVRTDDLDAVAGHHLVSRGATSLFKGYTQGDTPPFPADTCISVNDEVVHGIPSNRALKNGDLLCVDVGLKLDGWCGDSATAIVVGGADANPAAAKLIEQTREIIDLAVSRMKPGVRWSDIGRELEDRTEAMGVGLVTEYVGHGIGRELHEPPKAPCYWSGFGGDDFTLSEGMVLSIEPMLTLGRGPITGWLVGRAGLPAFRMPVQLDPKDGWTVRTADGSFACHEERMVAVTATGARVLASPGGASGGAER